MKASFSIEFIGADTYQWFKGMTRMYNNILPGGGNYLIGGVPKGSKPWLAEITGRHPKFKLARNFLKPQWDYSEANSCGSRGVRLHYILESGKLYQVSGRVSWKRTEKYFLTVSDTGEISRLSDEVAEQWLNAN